jgi:hypothetical protein
MGELLIKGKYFSNTKWALEWLMQLKLRVTVDRDPYVG